MHSDKQVIKRVYKASATVLALAMTLAPASTVYSQSLPSVSHSSFDPDVPATVSEYETVSITRNISAVRDECSRVDPRYRIDCLRKGLITVAERIPPQGEYAEARRIISQTAARLGEVQRKHADPAAADLESQGNARFPAKRTYKAVKREKLAEAMQEANKIIEEAETQLLRAAENSEKRSAHYQEIAAAIGSTKVLLRS